MRSDQGQCATPIRALQKREFVLWRIASPAAAPVLVVGRLHGRAPVTLADEQQLALKQSAEFPDLWTVAAADCGLVDGQVHPLLVRGHRRTPRPLPRSQ